MGFRRAVHHGGGAGWQSDLSGGRRDQHAEDAEDDTLIFAGSRLYRERELLGKEHGAGAVGGVFFNMKRFDRRARRGGVAAAIAFCMCAGVTMALSQTAISPASMNVPDISGFWERKDEFGGGSFGGTLERIPKASIKP